MERRTMWSPMVPLPAEGQILGKECRRAASDRWGLPGIHDGPVLHPIRTGTSGRASHQNSSPWFPAAREAGDLHLRRRDQQKSKVAKSLAFARSRNPVRFRSSVLSSTRRRLPSILGRRSSIHRTPRTNSSGWIEDSSKGSERRSRTSCFPRKRTTAVVSPRLHMHRPSPRPA